MKNYYFAWWNRTKDDVQVDFICAENIEAARTTAVCIMNRVDLDHMHDYSDEDIRIIDELPEYKDESKKKYYFTWFCNHKRTEFLYAENVEEAKKMAVLIMRLKGGLIYDIRNIQELRSIDDKFYNMEQLKEEYESKVGKYFK